MSNESPQIGYLLKQAQSLLHSRMEEALRPLELTVSHYSCLFHLSQGPGISASELARRTFVTRQSMNVMLQQLIDRELVARPAQAHAGRALPSALTARGMTTLAEAQNVVDAIEHRMLAGLTAVEAVDLGRLLTTCAISLAS